jgi:hypothetical protein
MKKRKAREWWVHEDDGEFWPIYPCETPFAEDCGCCVRSKRVLVREVLPPAKRKRTKA